jgi:hypothetical protein
MTHAERSYRSESYSLRHVVADDLPLLELYRNGDETARPLLLIHHGFGSRKERKLQHAYMAAEAGFFVVLPDSARHGERQDPEFAALSEEEGGTRMIALTRQTAVDLAHLLALYSDDPRTSSDRTSLMGTSMGGMVVYEYLQRYGTAGIACAVPIISTPAWKAMADHLQLQNPAFGELMTPELEREIEEAEPREALLGLRDFPLLMLNAEDDEIMPIAHVREFYREMQRHYSRPELLRLETYAGSGHMTTEEMMRSSIAWASRHTAFSE